MTSHHRESSGASDRIHFESVYGSASLPKPDETTYGNVLSALVGGAIAIASVAVTAVVLKPR